MISVSENAANHFEKLIEQQDIPGLGLRLKALNPGLPTADVELTFCETDELQEDDHQQRCNSFHIYIDDESYAWLDKASIDFLANETGGQLSIKAPGLKGSAPASDASLAERVQWMLDTEINPQIALHGGQVGLIEITEDQIVVLQFGGGCQGCGQANVTLQEGIEKNLLKQFPELKGVRDVTDHSAGENPYYA